MAVLRSRIVSFRILWPHAPASACTGLS